MKWESDCRTCRNTNGHSLDKYDIAGLQSEHFIYFIRIFFRFKYTFGRHHDFQRKTRCQRFMGLALGSFFIPILGFILYLLFGHNLRRKHLFQWEDRKKIGIEKAAEVSAERSEVEAIPI